jgi:hypothetical protein
MLQWLQHKLALDRIITDLGRNIRDDQVNGLIRRAFEAPSPSAWRTSSIESALRFARRTTSSSSKFSKSTFLQATQPMPGLQQVMPGTQPVPSLQGGQGKVTDSRFTSGLGVDQMLKTGATYSASFSSYRATSTNVFSTFDPLLNSALRFNISQPLVREKYYCFVHYWKKLEGIYALQQSSDRGL